MINDVDDDNDLDDATCVGVVIWAFGFIIKKLIIKIFSIPNLDQIQKFQIECNDFNDR